MLDGRHDESELRVVFTRLLDRKGIQVDAHPDRRRTALEGAAVTAAHIDDPRTWSDLRGHKPVHLRMKEAIPLPTLTGEVSLLFGNRSTHIDVLV
jgi:hypothetical protein